MVCMTTSGIFEYQARSSISHAHTTAAGRDFLLTHAGAELVCITLVRVECAYFKSNKCMVAVCFYFLVGKFVLIREKGTNANVESQCDIA